MHKHLIASSFIALLFAPALTLAATTSTGIDLNSAANQCLSPAPGTSAAATQQACNTLITTLITLIQTLIKARNVIPTTPLPTPTPPITIPTPTVPVVPIPPTTPTPPFSATPQSGQMPLTVTFSTTLAPNYIDFGDGSVAWVGGGMSAYTAICSTTANGSCAYTIAHIYRQNGTYTAKLVTKDQQVLSTLQITVSPVATSPGAITVTSPTANALFHVGDQIPMAWSYSNIPANSQAILTLSLIQQSQTMNGVSGGTWQSNAISGNGQGTDNWQTGNVGYLNIPGTYQLSAKVRQCDPLGCQYSYPSDANLPVSATAPLVYFTIAPGTTVPTPTPTPLQSSGTIDPGTLTTSNTNPTLSGTATGVQSVGIAIGNSGGKAYGSGTVSALNGHWSVTVNPALPVGTYSVTLYGFSDPVGSLLVSTGGGVLATGTLTIMPPTPAPSPTPTTTPTVQTGSLSVSVDPSSPSYMLVTGGTTGQLLAALKIHATGESMALNKLGLSLASGSPQDLSQIYLYSSSGTPLGTATFTGTNTSASVILATPPTVSPGADAILLLKADIANVGTGFPGKPGELIKVDPTSYQATGATSGSVVSGSATGDIAGVRTYKSIPSVFASTLPSTGVADGRFLRFRIMANPSGSIGIKQFTFALTGNGTISNVGLYAYTDPSFSQPVSGQGALGEIGSLANPLSGANLVVVPSTNPVEIPTGATYYFELRGTVASSTSPTSIAASLLGDSTASNSMNPTGNFLWSPNDNGTAGFSDADWVNGNMITALPAGQTRLSSAINPTSSNQAQLASAYIALKAALEELLSLLGH